MDTQIETIKPIFISCIFGVCYTGGICKLVSEKEQLEQLEISTNQSIWLAQAGRIFGN
jgi:hypothetical protein